MHSNKRWTLLELLNTTTQFLKEKKIENPRLNAEQLMCKTLGLDRVQLYVSFERPLTNSEIDTYRSMVKRRINREPLQYITGMTEFMGFPFIVNKNVLIPRPETEILSEEIANFIKMNNLKNPAILDIGAGSGCIAVSLAGEITGSKILAIDISDNILNIARQNAEMNNIPVKMHPVRSADDDEPVEGITLIKQDIMKPWPDSLENTFDLIVSNPPYITQKEITELEPEVKDFEPLEALTDFGDGLQFYRRIFDLTGKNHTLECKYLFLEMSGSQPERIIELAGSYNFKRIDTIPDLNKISRVLKIEVAK